MAKKKKVSDNPVERLYDAGFSWFTMGRVANVPVRRVKSWKEELTEGHAGIEKLRSLVTLYDAMLSMDLAFDPVSLYEEQLVIIDLDDSKRYVRLAQFFESKVWTDEEFLQYVGKIKEFFSSSEFREIFPDDYETVELEDGEKAIVNKNAIESIGNAELIRRKDDIKVTN